MTEHGVALAMDPGPIQTAWVVFGPATRGLRAFGITPNEELIERFRTGVAPAVETVVIEEIESFGMPVGREIFDTVWWAGRYAEALRDRELVRLSRRKVKTHLCGSARAKDPNVRQVILDRYGGAAAARKGGPLAGVSKDVWSALALAVTWAEGGHR